MLGLGGSTLGFGVKLYGLGSYKYKEESKVGRGVLRSTGTP